MNNKWCNLHRKKDGSFTFYHKYRANLTQLKNYKESHIFAIFVHVQTTVCIPAMFEDVKKFLNVFRSIVEVFAQ